MYKSRFYLKQFHNYFSVLFLGLCKQDYRSLCAVVTICATTVDPTCEFTF